METILSHSISYHLPAGEALMCREPWLGGEGRGGEGCRAGESFVETQVTQAVPNPRAIPSWSFPFLDLGVGSGGKHLLLLTPREKSIVNVRSVMELSGTHEIGYMVNGETYILRSAVTPETMTFL